MNAETRTRRERPAALTLTAAADGGNVELVIERLVAERAQGRHAAEARAGERTCKKGAVKEVAPG